MYFLELRKLINEAIRIHTKISDKVKENPNYKIPVNKATFSSRELPKIDNYKIVINSHTKETRKGEDLPRDYNFTDNDYKRILFKFINRIKSDNLKHGKYSLFYKSKTKDYDMLGVVYNHNRIEVITIIQQSKPVNSYKFSSELDNSDRLILENYKNIIIL